MRPFALGFFILANTVGVGEVAAASQDKSQKALALLEKTKAVTGTYSAYYWNRITIPDKEPVEEWSAEFHSGSLHRVETPRNRVIANCAARTGVALDLSTQEIFEGPQVASAACGINTNFPIIKMEWLGAVRSAFGKARRVRVVDSANVRQYDVSENGILLASTYSENREGGSPLLVMEAVGLEKRLPEQDMFDRGSLARSFVPEGYKQRSVR